MKQLHLARGLSLPLDAVTQKIAVLGTSGSGKSYCMTKLAEQMLDAKAQAVIIDPKAEAWGLRLKADGKTPAYDIPVLGGEHGDAPLRADMGARVAELIVANDYSCVLDVSEFIPQEWAQFCYEFATRLLQLKKQKKSAMCLMIDEAHDFIPQNPDEKGWVPKMLGAMQRIQKLGRALGIGMVLSSQRPQDVSKKALNLCELWINFQLVGTHERDATVKTIGERDREASKDLDALLPTLEIGHAYVWSPRWLKVKGVYHVLQKTTFDSSATPEVGAKPVEPRKLSPVDLKALQEDLREVIEEAKQNDPKELKRQVADLKRELGVRDRQLAERQAATVQAEPETVEVPVLNKDDLDRLDAIIGRAEKVIAQFNGFGDALRESADAIRGGLSRYSAPSAPTRKLPADSPRRTVTQVRELESAVSATLRAHQSAGKQPQAVGDFTPTKSQQRVLDALAFFESIGIPEPSNLQVGAVALMDSTGGHFSNVVGPLSTAGLIIRDAGRMRFTDVGRALARIPDRVATLDEYHDVLRARVLKARQASKRTVDILNVVIDHTGEPVSNEEIGREVGIDHTGGHFSNTIGPLSTLGLIRRSGGLVYPTEILFPEGLS